MKETIKTTATICIVLGILVFWVAQTFAEPPALARLSGAEKERVLKLIDGAKKEGELVAYSGNWRPDVQAMMLPKFYEEYGLSESDLKIKILSTRTGAIVTKVTQELRAKIYKTDIVHIAALGWVQDLVKRGELMAYESPEYKYFAPIANDPSKGPAHPPYFISHMFQSYTLSYNPKFLKGKIEHWKDVLKPEYKGKIVCGDLPKSYSYTDAYIALRKVLSKDYWKQLGAMKPHLIASTSSKVNKLISGEFAIDVFASGGTTYRANKKGAGIVLVFPPEGWPAIGWPAFILAHAPHPNAAKLLIDFVHSKAGAQIVQKTGFMTGRKGIKPIDPVYPRPIYDMKGFVEMDWRKVSNEDREQAVEQFKKYFGL